MQKDFLNVLSVEEIVNRLLAFPPLGMREYTLDSLAGTFGTPSKDSISETRELFASDAFFSNGSVLAQDIISPETLPPANRSGMDGYAVQAEDLFGASENNPVWLDCVGDIAIDRPADFTLQPGQCASIVTGGHLPEGANAVIMIEHTRPFGAGVIEMRRSVAPGEDVMQKGDDARAGTVALHTGTLLRPQEIGLLAALGITRVPVFRRPEVAILSTGDELVSPHATPRPGQIRDVNSLALSAMTSRIASVSGYGIVPDNAPALAAVLRSALAGKNGQPADVVFLSGGSSIGVRDLTLDVLQSLENAEIFCHGAALSPGKPLILARCGTSVIWGLPGQVTSAQVVMFILGLPFLRHLSGYSFRQLSEEMPFRSDDDRNRTSHAFDQSRWPSVQAVLTRNIASRQGREDYIRVRLESPTHTDERLRAVPVPGLSGLLRTLIDAQGVVRIPARLEGLEAGTPVNVLLF